MTRPLKALTGRMAPAAIVTGIFVLAAACSSSAQPVRRQAPNDIVATIGSHALTLAEVDEVALQQSASNFGSARLAQALYEARRTALDEMIGNLLLDQEAKTRGMERAALVEKEVTTKVVKPTDAEVEGWYKANQARIQGATIDQARAPIQEMLVQERTHEARRAYIDRLQAGTPVALTLEPPRQTVKPAANAAVRGPANAPIELIEFSDFECPFCLRATPTVRQVINAYGDRVRLVYRHYPLRSHPNARPAAEAAECAADQEKFWPYHDRLFGTAGKLSAADLKQAAVELGLDADKFNDCFDTRKHKGKVDADIAAANEAGVTGTPAFFINGRSLSGAQPFEAFKQIIDEELAARNPRR